MKTEVTHLAPQTNCPECKARIILVPEYPHTGLNFLLHCPKCHYETGITLPKEHRL